MPERSGCLPPGTEGTAVTDEVLLIGLDAACFEQLDPFLSAGTLPTLSGLVNEGVATDMPTTTPPWTPSAWSSITTGTRPWTHGVYDFHHYPAEGPAEYVSARAVQVPFLWELLSAAGYSSVVVNVPVTHPIHRFSGSLVPGYIAPEASTCLVDSNPTSIDTIAPAYRIYPRSEDGRADRLSDYEELIESRATVASALADRTDPSFTMVQFQSTDGVFHTLGDREAVRRVFRCVDDAIDRLVRTLDPEWTIVVSDHGIHRYSRVFHANTWLRNQDQLRTAPESKRRTWNDRTVAERANQDPRERVSGPANRLFTMLGRVGLSPQRLESVLCRLGLDELVSRLLPDSVLLDAVDAAEHVDWEASAVYCRSSAAMGLRCNIAGRDPGGVVPEEDFADLRRTLVEALRSVDSPTGEPVFERVYDRHAVHGSDVANERSAPDIVFRPTDMEWRISDVIRERTFGTTNAYDHNYGGLFIAAGPNVDPGENIAPAVPDVAPTIMSLLGMAPPAWMEGDPLLPLVPMDRDAQTAPTVPEREYLDDARPGETVQTRLRELGYV